MSTPTLRDYVDDLLTAARTLREEEQAAKRREYDRRRAGWLEELDRRKDLMVVLMHILGIPEDEYELIADLDSENDYGVEFNVSAAFDCWRIDLGAVDRRTGTDNLILKTYLYVNPGDEYKDINLSKMFQGATHRQWPYGPLRREIAVYTAEAEQVIRAKFGSEMEHLMTAVEALPAFVTEVNAERARKAAEDEERARQQRIEDEKNAARFERLEQEMLASMWAAEIEADLKRQEDEAALATALELAPEALSAILRVIRWEIERHADKCF